MNNGYVSATKDNIISFIRQCRNRIAFVGTGFNTDIAKELVLKKDIVESIVIDNGRDTYNIGYGTVESLDILKNAGIPLKETCNIRINVFALDDKALVYSPTPLVIEEGVNNGFPNAIMVDYHAVKSLFKLDDVDKKTFKNQEASIIEEPTQEGSSTKLLVKDLTPQDVEETVKVVAKNPPKIDLNRQLHTYTSKIKFIEIQLTGFNFKQHKVKIPNELLMLSNSSESVKSQLSATYNMFNSIGEESVFVRKISEIQDRVKGLRRDYIVNLPKYGSMCLVSKVSEIVEEANKIRQQIESMKANFNSKVDKEIEKSKKLLIDALVPIVKRNPPKELKNSLVDAKKISVETAKSYVKDQLDKAFVSGDQYLEDMELEIRYKDLTLDTLEREDFIDIIMNSKWKYNFINEGIVKYEDGLAERKNKF